MASSTSKKARHPTGGITSYQANGVTYWRVNVYLKLQDGQVVQFRKRKIPTREQAHALVAKRRSEAFEGKYFDRVKSTPFSVKKAWELYQPKSERENAVWKTEASRAGHLVRHLGTKNCSALTIADVDHYRDVRLTEKTCRKRPPLPATLDAEVGLLKRIVSYAVSAGKFPVNPIAKVRFLMKPNTRRTVIDPPTFEKLLAATDDLTKPILILLYDGAFRKREVLDLRWSQVDLDEGFIRLSSDDTKTEQARMVYLTKRAKAALEGVPRKPDQAFVFVNPRTGQVWYNIRKVFGKAAKVAGVPEAWVHDLRRSSITNMRKSGVQETVVMKISGHKSRYVFARYNIIDDLDLREATKRLEQYAAQTLGKV